MSPKNRREINSFAFKNWPINIQIFTIKIDTGIDNIDCKMKFVGIWEHCLEICKMNSPISNRLIVKKKCNIYISMVCLPILLKWLQSPSLDNISQIFNNNIIVRIGLT